MHVCGDYNHEYIEITTSGNEALICVFHSNETFSFIITTSFSDLMAIIGQAVTTSPYTYATVICCFIQKLFQLQCLSLLVIIIPCITSSSASLLSSQASSPGFVLYLWCLYPGRTHGTGNYSHICLVQLKTTEKIDLTFAL